MILLCLAIIGVWDLITAWVLTTVGGLIMDGDSTMAWVLTTVGDLIIDGDSIMVGGLIMAWDLTMVGVLIDGALEEDS